MKIVAPSQVVGSGFPRQGLSSWWWVPPGVVLIIVEVDERLLADGVPDGVGGFQLFIGYSGVEKLHDPWLGTLPIL